MNLPSDESAFKSTRAQLKTATSGNLELVSRPKTDQSAKIHDYLASRSLKRISESQNTKSQSSFRHVDQGEDWCTLNDPKLPPITEMEHMVDQCLCHLCDCGKHVCPHDYRRMFKSASSQFSTLYKIKYPKHPLPIINNNSKKVYSPNKLPIDLLTTNRKDYVAYVIEPKKKDIPHSDHLKVKFAGKSFYQSEYPNWGPYRAEKVKILNLPYRGGEVKFNGSSSYQNDFRVLEEFNDLNIKITNRSLQKSSGVISPSTDFMGQTTFNRDFKPHNKRNIPKREKGLQHESRPTSTWTGQYSTTYRDTFTGTMNPLYQRKKGAQNAS